MKRWITLVASALLLGGCATPYAPHPQATLFPNSDQQKFSAAEHWNILAANEAKLIIKGYDTSFPIYVTTTSKNAGPFSQAYNSFLISHLVQQGANVVTTRTNNSAEVTYNIQVVRHSKRKNALAYSGSYTALGAGAWIIGSIVNSGTPELALLPIAGIADITDKTYATNTEVIVTTQVTQGSRLHMSDSRIYYVNPNAASQYTEASSSKAFSVSNNL